MSERKHCVYCGCELDHDLPCFFCGRDQEPLPEASVSAAWEAWVAATWHHKPNLQAVRCMLYAARKAGLHGDSAWKAEAQRLAKALDDWGYGDYDARGHVIGSDGKCTYCGETEGSCPYGR